MERGVGWLVGPRCAEGGRHFSDVALPAHATSTSSVQFDFTPLYYLIALVHDIISTSAIFILPVVNDFTPSIAGIVNKMQLKCVRQKMWVS